MTIKKVPTPAHSQSPMPKSASKDTSKVALKPKKSSNAPLEMSSKARPAQIRKVFATKQAVRRDPRFDDMCGELDVKKFDRGYKFLHDLRREEYAHIKKAMSEETDSAALGKLKAMESKYKSEFRSKDIRMRAETLREEYEATQKKLALEGKKPRHVNAADLKTFEKVARYDYLKSNNMLTKYIEKKRIKLASKDKKNLNF